MSKLPHIGTSIFTQMTQLANRYNAINLSQGFPNFAIDARLSEIVARKAFENVHQYQPAAGNPDLLQKIAGLIADSYCRTVDPEYEILVTAGATQGIFTAIQAVVNAGDEVVLLDPCYDSYETPVLLAGARAVHVPLCEDYTPDWTAINAAVNSSTRLIIINTPHNPSGRMWSAEDFDLLEQLLIRYPRLLVLSDEVYEHIAFEQPHRSIHQRPQLLHRSISVSSFGKSFHITGWKVGYVVATRSIMDEIKKIHQFLVFSVNSLAQAALAEYIDRIDLQQLSDFYLQKRDTFQNMLSKTRLKLMPCQGSYFQVVSYGNLSTESDVDFTHRLVTDFGVAAIPVSRFYADGKDQRHIRLCFAKDNETLMAAAVRLEKL